MKDCKKLKIFVFLFIIFIVITVSFIINSNISKNRKWYECIKADITPKSIVFTIVWSILYIILGICLSEILCINNKHTRYYISTLYIINLLISILWAYLYFHIKDIYLSKIIMSIILGTSIIICYIMYKYRLKYRHLYLLYVLWIGFAYILNILSSYKENNCKKYLNNKIN
jgi:benzodiazapine receptor